MDSGKTLKNIGAVASIVGLIITIYGFIKFRDAQTMLSASRSLSSFSNTGNFKSIRIWEGYSNNYKLILIIGAIILIIGIILLISGLMSGSNVEPNIEPVSDNTVNDVDISDRLKTIDNLRAEGLISQEEYEEKRNKLISSI